MRWLLCLALAGCAAAPGRELVARANRDLHRLGEIAGQAEWARWTNITPETEAAAATARAELGLLVGELVRAARKVRNADPETRRQLDLLTRALPQPVPADPALAAELTQVRERLLSLYGARACVEGVCKTSQEIGAILRESHDPAELRRWWTAWHDAADPMAAPYERFVTLSNLGARDLGYRDVGQLWRSWYDEHPEELEADVRRLWGEVEPLYRKLHCAVRSRLAERYPGEVRIDRPIPAHLLGNAWAQDWRALAPLFGVTPRVGRALDLDAIAMTRRAEGFYVSLGFPPLPASFWSRSMFVKPIDREVICQPGVHDLGHGRDPRLSMCLRPVEKDLTDLHHELGHAYYNVLTAPLPTLYRDSPHDGFHEAVGDALTLSLHHPGEDRLARLTELALDKLPYLAFAMVVDEWRADVFAGKIPRAQWNRAWWRLRERYQGIAPPSPRGEEHFDPGAKFHIASGHPYLRYFLALVLQFQIHAALCPRGELDRCSIEGDRQAGARLIAFMKLGATRPWPDALETLTGSRKMDARPMLRYFAPLAATLPDCR